MKKLILVLCFLSTLLFASKPQSIISSVCYNCHGDKMQLSCFGVTKVVNTMEENSIKDALLAYKDGSRDSYGMGNMMQSQIGGLSIEEIKSLAKYIPTLK